MLKIQPTASMAHLWQKSFLQAYFLYKKVNKGHIDAHCTMEVTNSGGFKSIYVQDIILLMH